MESVVLAAPRDVTAELKQRLKKVGPVIIGANGILVIESGSTRVYLARSDAVRDEFEPDDLRRITLRFSDPVFYTVDFSDIALCRRVMMAIADDPDLLVDNDHGLLLPGSEFVALLCSRGTWGWRTESP